MVACAGFLKKWFMLFFFLILSTPHWPHTDLRDSSEFRWALIFLMFSILQKIYWSRLDFVSPLIWYSSRVQHSRIKKFGVSKPTSLLGLLGILTNSFQKIFLSLSPELVTKKPQVHWKSLPCSLHSIILTSRKISLKTENGDKLQNARSIVVDCHA